MSFRVLMATLALAATVPPLASAQSRPDAVYQAFADRIREFVATNGCGGDAARNPATGRVLPPIWLRFIFHDAVIPYP
ncbi:hypothetical protein BDK51DRAFT_43843 [Blyttiomyces helicus]|uniref:Uncharacterized protein n=1 Tax=Blyttiomyces helicus TaxID=388810 RepID=A0A4P9W818_9FUNG|nr:hypothetical protein BDK51DRAFT_43843 [Blyttiomyces helicus]|eukprot:RKO86306.1 hypothetical protein BDK51DRAFT_43843 [Blyttiomyces helicus]